MIPRLMSEHALNVPMPGEFFHKLGNLHDAEILRLEWSPGAQELIFLIDDLYSNFVGLPEYPGQQRIQLTIAGVHTLAVDVTRDRFPLRIMDFEVEELSTETALRMSVKFSPCGSIQVSGKSIACSPL